MTLWLHGAVTVAVGRTKHRAIDFDSTRTACFSRNVWPSPCTVSSMYGLQCALIKSDTAPITVVMSELIVLGL